MDIDRINEEKKSDGSDQSNDRLSEIFGVNNVLSKTFECVESEDKDIEDDDFEKSMKLQDLKTLSFLEEDLQIDQLSSV